MRTVVFDDGSGQACAAHRECRAFVRAHRESAIHLVACAERNRGSPTAGAMAVLDLSEYDDFESVLSSARAATKKPGRANRELDRARRAGYYFKEFAFAQFVPDIVEIWSSKQFRDGRALAEKYVKSIDELGGAPRSPSLPQPPKCSLHNTRYWGVFIAADGHFQGSVQTNEQLVAYAMVMRCGDSACYSQFMGHGNHLHHGIAYLLHYAFVEKLLRDRPQSPRYLHYDEYVRFPGDKRTHWKHLALFKPVHREMADLERLNIPLRRTPPAGDALLAAKELLSGAEAHHALSSIAVEWQRIIYRACVVNTYRAGALMAFIHGLPDLPLASLRGLVPPSFPFERLACVKSAAVILHDHSRGLDTLLPILDAGIQSVTVLHPHPDCLAILCRTYPANWNYAPFHHDSSTYVNPNTELVLVDPPQTGAVKFLVEILPTVLKRYDGPILVSIPTTYSGFSLAAQNLASAIFSDRGIVATYFRHALPEPAFWVYTESCRGTLKDH